MAEVILKAKPLNYPNFLLLNVPGHSDGTVSLDVGAAFPTDTDAGEFWDSAKVAWIEHVKARRQSLSASAEGK